MCGRRLTVSQKVKKWPFLSFRRKPESKKNMHFGTPAGVYPERSRRAGVTALMTFYETVKIEERKEGRPRDQWVLLR
jgi:hypothetical protein